MTRHWERNGKEAGEGWVSMRVWSACSRGSNGPQNMGRFSENLSQKSNFNTNIPFYNFLKYYVMYVNVTVSGHLFIWNMSLKLIIITKFREKQQIQQGKMVYISFVNFARYLEYLVYYCFSIHLYIIYLPI